MRIFKYTVLSLALSTTWLLPVSAQTRAAEVLVDSLKNKNQTISGNPVSSRPIWLFSPLRVVDSTSAGLQPFSLYTRNDTVKAWLNRSISGDRFGFTMRVRSLGRNESNIAAGLAAMSKGNDSAYSAVNVQADGMVQLGGRRRPGGSGFASFLEAYYDSTIQYIGGIRRVKLQNNGALWLGDLHADTTDTPSASVFHSLLQTSSSSGAVINGIFRANQLVGTTGSIQGVEGYVKLNNPSDDVALALGVIGNVEMANTGTATDVRPFQGGGVITGTGDITRWSTFYAQPLGVDGGVNTIDTAYMFYGHVWPSGITINNKWGVYIRDPLARNFFAGSIIGNTSIILYPSVGYSNSITIKAGSTSASYGLTLPTAQGAASTYLKNNGSGTLSWATISSGSTATDSVYRVLYSASSDTVVSSEANVFPKIFRQTGAGGYATQVKTYYVKQPGDSAIVAKFLFTLKKNSVGGRARLNFGSAPEVAKTTSVTDTVVTLRATLSGITNDSSYTLPFELRSDDATDTVVVKNLTIYAVKYVTTAATSGTGLDSTAVDTLSVMYVPATSGIIATSSTTTLWASDTTMRVVMFEIPHAIRVDTVYHRQLAASANDTIVYALYDRDGDLKWRTAVQLTTGGTTNTYVMPVVTPVLVPAGTYYWAWMQSGGYNPSSQMTFTDAQMDALVTMNTLSGYGLPAHSGEAANKWSPSANSVPSTLGTITRRATTDNWVPPVAIMVGAK